MQKSNDNEIVQYLGVKHIINYLEVQVGLTQTLHFEGYLQYYVGRIWNDGEGGLPQTAFGSVSNCLYTYMHTYVCECVCLAVPMCTRECIY